MLLQTACKHIHERISMKKMFCKKTVCSLTNVINHEGQIIELCCKSVGLLRLMRLSQNSIEVLPKKKDEICDFVGIIWFVSEMLSDLMSYSFLFLINLH